MRNHWAACAFACALIAILPARLAAQTTAPTPAQAPTPANDELAKWGPYARLAGQTMKDVNPSGYYRVQWRWETAGQVLLEEWYGGTAEPGKPGYVMTIRLGPQPGTFNLKSSVMMGKEWVGALQDDGSVSYVGKGLLKMPYRIRIDEQGLYEHADTKGHVYKFAAVESPATPVAVVQTPPAPKPVLTIEPTPPVTSEKPAVVAAKPRATLPSATPVKVPRKLSEADLALLRESVQESRARVVEQARLAELQRQEAARQRELEYRAMEAAQAQRRAEIEEADAEYEAESARKAAAWQQMAQANEQALNDSIQRLRDTTSRIEAQQASASAQSTQADPLGSDERQRQVELIRQANQRQDDEAARLAAQRQQAEADREPIQQQSSAGDFAGAGHASTDTDANRCVTSPELRENDTFQGNTAAYVVNGCGTPVDVRICLMTESGWKCGVRWGLASQARWSHSVFHFTGPVFVDARVTGSSRKFADPN